jgi:hypothetical protein
VLLLLLLCSMLVLSRTAIAALQCHSSGELFPWLFMYDQHLLPMTSDGS